jgi:hypothetical protein
MTAVLILFGNSAASIPESCKRCRVNGLRETFGVIGAPIRPSMRSGGANPYAPKRRGERFCGPRGRRNPRCEAVFSFASDKPISMA